MHVSPDVKLWVSRLKTTTGSSGLYEACKAKHVSPNARNGSAFQVHSKPYFLILSTHFLCARSGQRMLPCGPVETNNSPCLSSRITQTCRFPVFPEWNRLRWVFLQNAGHSYLGQVEVRRLFFQRFLFYYVFYFIHNQHVPNDCIPAIFGL